MISYVSYCYERHPNQISWSAQIACRLITRKKCPLPGSITFKDSYRYEKGEYVRCESVQSTTWCHCYPSRHFRLSESLALPPSVRARLRLPSISPPSPSRRNHPNLNFIMAECKVWSGRAGEAVVQHHISKSLPLPPFLPPDTKTAQEQLSTKAKLREERGV